MGGPGIRDPSDRQHIYTACQSTPVQAMATKATKTRECPECSEAVDARGMNGHLRFKHGYTTEEAREALGSDGSRSKSSTSTKAADSGDYYEVTLGDLALVGAVGAGLIYHGARQGWFMFDEPGAGR